MTIKMAIIGFGKSANRYHIPYLLQQNQFQLKTIFDLKRNIEMEKLYKDHSIVFTTEIEDILMDDEISVVTICTPPSTHYELGKLFLEHDKNVIIEKPFCETIEAAVALQTLAKQRGLIVQPYQNRRFDSDYLTLKKILNVDFVGDPIEIESHFNYFRPNNQVNNGGQLDGAFYWMGVHLIDQIVALYGEPDKVEYDLRSIQNIESTTEDYFDIHLFYKSLKVRIKSSPLVAMEVPRFIVHGTKGTYIKFGTDQQKNDLKVGLNPGCPFFVKIHRIGMEK